MNKTIDLQQKQQNETCGSPKIATGRIDIWYAKIGVGAALLLVLATSIQVAAGSVPKAPLSQPDLSHLSEPADSANAGSEIVADRQLVTKFIDLIEAKKFADAYDTLQQIEYRPDIYTRSVSRQDVMRILHAAPKNVIGRRFAHDYLEAGSNKFASDEISEQLDRGVVAAGFNPRKVADRIQLGDLCACTGDLHGAALEYRRALHQQDNANVRKKLALMMVGFEKHEPRKEQI